MALSLSFIETRSKQGKHLTPHTNRCVLLKRSQGRLGSGRAVGLGIGRVREKGSSCRGQRQWTGDVDVDVGR